MTFSEAFLCGSGLMLGICVVAVLWVLIRIKVLQPLDTIYQNFAKLTLAALLDRNRIAENMADELGRIANMMEHPRKDSEAEIQRLQKRLAIYQESAMQTHSVLSGLDWDTCEWLSGGSPKVRLQEVFTMLNKAIGVPE